MSHELPPDNLTIPDNLIFQCRLLSVWRDGPFLAFVIPTMHSRATLTREEGDELLAALHIVPRNLPVKVRMGVNKKSKRQRA